MKARLQCEVCGRLVDPSQLDGAHYTCVHCGNEVRSADLAAPGAQSAHPDTPSSLPVSERIAAAFPWVASVLLHVSLGLMMLLVTIALTRRSDDRSVPIEAASLTPMETVDRNVLRDPRPIPSFDEEESAWDTPSPFDRDPVVQAPQIPRQAPAIGVGPSSEEPVTGEKGPSFFGVRLGGSGRGSVRFMHGGKADVVYVLDRSGSMAMGGLFDAMCRELVVSLSAFRPGFQRYHVVFFGEGTCHEDPSRGLTEPTEEALVGTTRWLTKLQARGQTDPRRALNRAFDVLQRRRNPDRGAVIFLLTDAVFPDNSAVTKLIRRRNRKKQVRIHTLLLGSRPDEAVKIMKQIASENGGKYKYIAGQ